MKKVGITFFSSPFCASHIFISSAIPKEDYIIVKPTFFGAAMKDAICLAAQGKDSHAKYCPNTTIVEFDTAHWVQNALPDKTNAELLKWIESL